MEKFIILAGVQWHLSDLDHVIITGILILVIISVIIGYMGKRKKIGFINAWMFSFFCTPIVGIILVLLSKKIYTCPHCGFETTDLPLADYFCPECGKNIAGLKAEEIIISPEPAID